MAADDGTPRHAMLANDHGVRPSFHPHVGTAVEYEPEIDRLLADTALDRCFDTGHHAFRDQDPLAYMDESETKSAGRHHVGENLVVASHARVPPFGLPAVESPQGRIIPGGV